MYFHITPYLYEETVSCDRFYELLAFQHQLEAIGISVKRKYYSKEFEYDCNRIVLCRKYGSIPPLWMHFSLLLEFHY